MARLGRLLERHGAGGVVVMSSQEYERAQLSTYAAGWQDAAQEYGPRISAARWEGWLGRWRPLRLLDEPADVIAFPAGPAPAESQGQGKDDQVADEFGPPSGERPGLAVRGRTPVPRPYLSPKSRRSKSPTIPRLPPPDRRRPRTAGDAPEDGPE